MVAKHWENGKVADACEELVEEATKRWKEEDDIIDDITVIVIYLKCSF